MITLQQMREAIKAAVEERGEDFIYPRDNEDWMINGVCRYRLEDGTPACIVGLAMSKIDPSIVLPEEQDAFDALEGIAETEAQRYANDVQGRQDCGDSWGRALRCVEGNVCHGGYL